MIVGSLEVAVMLNVSNSFAAPELMPVRDTVWVPASSLMFKLLIGARVGGSFTGVTVTLKTRLTRLFEPALSLTVTVMKAEPKALWTGVKLRLPVALGLA